MSRKSQASGPALATLSSLVGPRKAAAPAGQQPGLEADAGSHTALAKSLQTAEELLRHCIHPNWRRLLPLHPSAGPGDSKEEEEEEEEDAAVLARLAQVECSFLGVSRSLCVLEDPHTETFQGHVRPDLVQATFSYHATRSSAARLCTTLHALLQQRHHLRLARHYSRRLKAASDFVHRLQATECSLLLPSSGCQEASWGPPLRGLCEELRTHTAHWDALQRHMRSDPWLRPLLLQRHEVVLRMKQAFSSLTLHALCLSGRCLEAQLRRLARAPCLPQASLSDFFQGLDIYNQVVREQPSPPFSVSLWAEPGSGSDWRRGPGGVPTFPVEKVLGILAAERGQRVASKLCPLLLGLQAPARSGEAMLPEGTTESWSPEVAPQAGEGAPSFLAELQALCHVEEEQLLWILGELVASTSSLWHHLLSRPKQERPPEGPEASPGLAGPGSASSPTWKTVRWLDSSYSEAALGLALQCRPLVWAATTTCLAHQLELRWPLAQFQARTLARLGQQLGHAPLQACIPQESTEELKGLLLRLVLRGVLQHWDQDFCRALGSSLTDRCVAANSTDAVCSRTARLLRRLFPPLAFSLQCLDSWSPGSTADGLLGLEGCHLVLLSLCVASGQASCYWVLGKASQYLASSSLGPFLLVSQGDLQLLKAEASSVAALVSSAPAGTEQKPRPLVSWQEQQLRQQARSMAASLQHFAEDVLTLFSSECKRLSAEIFGQTMPLGKHWRLARQTDVPCLASDYALAATQAVLGQVLQGVRLLPSEAQEPPLSQATASFLEAWLDHILTQKIKFSLQGAIQLKQDFELVRALLQSEESGLSAESRQRLLSLRIFQQVDNALACLLQQPGKASLPCHTWDSLRQCCSYNGIYTQDGGPGSLNSLENLECPPAHTSAPGESQAGDLLSRGQGGVCSPETYLSSPQQEWLALRLHGGRSWKVPSLPCMGRAAEP